jgi:protein CpxP
MMRLMRLTNLKAVYGALALAAALLLTGVGFASFAQGGPQGGFGGGGPRGERGRGPGGPRGGRIPFLHDLNLTDAQKAQIKQITDSAEASTKELRQRLDALHESELSGLTDGTFNEGAVRAAAQERANVQVELEVARARTMSQIFAVLTPEQKSQIAAKRQEFEQRRREHDAQHRDAPDEQ